MATGKCITANACEICGSGWSCKCQCVNINDNGVEKAICTNCYNKLGYNKPKTEDSGTSNDTTNAVKKILIKTIKWNK